MHPTRHYMNPVTSAHMQELAPPSFFWGFAILSTIGIFCWIVASIIFSPISDPVFHFGEDGAITALSSVIMAMSGAIAAIIFYLRIPDLNFGSLFWLALSAGCIFLSLDEQLMFHERSGHLIESGIGESTFFRNWNDLIVIGYGIIALAIAALFGREILKCRIFAVFFATAFVFYVIHTGIDSIVPNSFVWKDIPEESAKLMCVFALFLGISAQLMAVLEMFTGGQMASSKDPKQDAEVRQSE